MKRTRGFFWLLLVVTMLLAGMPLSSAAAAQTAFQSAAPAQRIGVSVVVLGIRDFDPRAGSFIADLYLNFECLEAIPCEPGNFEFTNGTILYLEDLSESDVYFSYRIQARLHTTLDFHNFPFDRQQLTLRMEDKRLDVTGLVYEAVDAETALDGELQVPGWEMVGATWAVDAHYYPTWDLDYSRYTFEVILQRPIISAMLKGLLPAGLVAMVAFFSLFTNATRSVNRLSTLTSTFIAGVLLHLNTTNVLPAVPYLTFTDGFMLGNYVVIVLSIGTAIGEIALSDGPHPLRAETVNRQARWILPLLWVLIQAVNALTLIR